MTTTPLPPSPASQRPMTPAEYRLAMQMLTGLEQLGYLTPVEASRARLALTWRYIKAALWQAVLEILTLGGG